MELKVNWAAIKQINLYYLIKLYLCIGSYNTYLKKYCNCVNVSDPKYLTAGLLCDVNVAKFMYTLALDMDWKPHAKKSGVAALNSRLKLLGVPSIYDDITLWPKTQAILTKWGSFLKARPHVTKSASEFSTAAMMEICGLVSMNLGEVQDVAIVSMGNFSSMRSRDLHALDSKNVTKLPMDKVAPRRYRFYLENMKNDMEGVRNVEEREFMVPCLCLESLRKEESAVFRKQLKTDPDAECCTICPYDAVSKYRDMVPDPTGEMREAFRRNSPSQPSLSFFRSRATLGMRQFLTTPLGINKIKGAFARVNARLDPLLAVERPSGHTGRHSFVSGAINGGVSCEVVAKASKHRCAEALMKYNHPKDNQKVTPAIAIGADARRGGSRSDDSDED
jgi:hypothetical protein